MSLEIFDFSQRKNLQLFWLVVALCLFLFISSAALLFAKRQKQLALDAEIHEANESAIFVAPPGILDPQAKFADLRDYEDTLHLAREEELPEPVAPARILDPTWDAKFNKPSK